ncbi:MULTISPECIES: DJ-1/PfpI family protein [Methylosinus]|uniref:Thiamine biosynthesis protein ThiJ n=1 Tax=Methylosinus trichosporium (strain ATCC 35070 / NCIMB 11131 / UNIQEM 75 / OB3b) TaxID=595536 RepID=A0A2D2D508_METT3|nr:MULTISPECIES: DJ-1/PfpI family protein [Methylosinus]ATQ70121.1 thiamine biosynthesis protein ThiJ [Methylosinus trichosporium OB3b]OBS54377.1 thiamine biosynthesis protein ThiJ [Methylosinus sp. 3S-1]
MTLQMVMLLFPRFQQLDLAGPFDVFARFSDRLQIHLAWKNEGAVADVNGLRIAPTVAFADCPQADILFVPGGAGQLPLMDDAETLDFLRRQGASARYVTSVCTGSLLLAAAGLLTGYRATSHWLPLRQLAHFGAEPIAERVVVDRNRVTGAGVTSGIDFALTLAALLFGEEAAKLAQLMMEYDPAPPFDCGSPTRAAPEIVERAREATQALQQAREEAAQRAAARLRS